MRLRTLVASQGGLKVGLNTEIRLRKEFQQLLASFKTPEQYAACSGEVGMSEEGQKIMSQMNTLKDPVKPEDLQRVIEKNGCRDEGAAQEEVW